MTYDEKKELAEWIAIHNNGALTGSIMLIERNVPIERLPEDIDIVVSSCFQLDDALLPPFIHDIQTTEEDNGYPVLARCWYKDVKIEFFVDDDALFNADSISTNVPYCQVSDLIKAKKLYLESDTNQDYLDKTIKDLQVLSVYQQQFPVIRYTVSPVGIMNKMVSNHMIHNKYIFVIHNMMDCNILENWKIKSDDYLSNNKKGLKQVLSIDSSELIEDIDVAKSLSKERWDKHVNPNGKYIVVQYFDDMFDKNITSEPVSKKEALDILEKCNNHRGYLYYYEIKAID